MILLSELSRRRIRSINKLLRVGKNEVVMVIRVDKEKGYIDLSKRRVSGADIRHTDERFSKSKAVHSVLRHVSTRLKVPLASLYARIAWPLARKYGHAFEAFSAAVLDPEPVFAQLPDVSAEEKAETCDFIRLRMTPQPLKIRADIQVTCFAYEGVNAVKAALLAGQALSTDAVPIKVQLIAPPLYVMLTTTLDKAAGIAALTASIDAIRAVLEAKGGRLVVKTAPTVTSQQDEGELARLLQGEGADGEGADEDEDDEDKGEEDNEEGMGSGELASGIISAGAEGGVEGEAAREAADAARRATAAAASVAQRRKEEEAARARILAAQEGGGAPSNAAAAAAGAGGPAAAGAPPPPPPAAAASADTFGEASKGDTMGEQVISSKKKKKAQVIAIDE